MFEHYGYVYALWELAGRRESELEYWRGRTIPYIFNRLAMRKEVMEEEVTK